ncbi:MAG: disulfide bond formation protein B [Methylophilaceae bacterium]|nr:disulfide bond formation protein B [Methylophilaceae bacterium]
MKNLTTFSKVNLFGAILSSIMIGAALLIQLIYQLEPCPLCITQRIIFIIISLTFVSFLFFKHNSLTRIIHLLMLGTGSIAGVIFSVRHIMIQEKWIAIPAECGIDLEYMFENFPLSQAMNLLFKGSGDCSSIDWNFIGITLPQLALMGYLLFLITAIITFLKVK